MPALLRDYRNELHGGCAGADHTYPLAAEVDGFVRPARGVERASFELVDAGDVRHVRCRQNAYS